jgi:peptidoglycan/LPS O-acetylase OafA/YrhL
MGLYRFTLAIAVIASHLGMTILNMNPGVIAVVQFFCITGFVMSGQLERVFPVQKTFAKNYLYFLRDRFLRIYPQFLFYTFSTLLAVKTLHITVPLINELTWTKITLDLLIIPMNFFMYFSTGSMIIPQAWSLGPEFLFYLILPLTMCGKYVFNTVTLGYLSFLFFLVPYFGILNTDYFGYRFLIGTFWIFVIGVTYSNKKNSFKIFRKIIGLSAGILFVVSLLDKEIGSRHYNREVLSGVIIYIILNETKVVRNLKFDRAIGDLSYGIFLNHNLVIWTFNHNLEKLHSQLLELLLIMCISTLLSYLSLILFEKPISRLRYKLRVKRGLADY